MVFVSSCAWADVNEIEPCVWGPSPAHLTWARLLLVRRRPLPNPTFLAFPRDTGVPALCAQPRWPPDSLLALESGLSVPSVSAPISPHVG